MSHSLSCNIQRGDFRHRDYTQIAQAVATLAYRANRLTQLFRHSRHTQGQIARVSVMARINLLPRGHVQLSLAAFLRNLHLGMTAFYASISHNTYWHD